MCGLVGIAGDLAYKDEATMKRMLLFDYFRGTDSTGLASITRGGDVKTAKIASHPLNIFEMPKFKDALNGTSSQIFLGHNRAATRGATSDYNAHPFTFKDVTGAHNGTLDTISKKVLEDTLNEKFDVDSQALFAAIAEFGIDAVLPMINEGMTSSDGAWALTWYDAANDTMNFIRNKHRPLWYAISKDKKQIFWASEWPIIEAAIQMSITGYELLADEKGFTYWQFDEDTHYQFKMSELKTGNWDEPRVGEIKGKEPVKAAAAGAGSDPFGRDSFTSMECGFQMTTLGTGTNTGGKGKTESRGKTSSNKEDLQPKVVHLLGDNDNPFAGIVSESDFALLSYGGCSYCGEWVDFQEPGITVYERDEKCLCPSCSGAPSDKTRIANKIYATDPNITEL